jgi:hypothetical protein
VEQANPGQLSGQAATPSDTVQSASLAAGGLSANADPGLTQSSRPAVAGPTQGKVGLQGTARTATQNSNTERVTHGASTLQPVQAGSHVAAVVTPIAGQDNSVQSRESAAGAAALNSSTGGNAASTNTSTGIGSRETFAALDAESGAGTPTWIHAGAQHAEAGFQDPTLGWIGVRAETGAGGVHASLVPSSADAAQALGGHLAGLNAYMAEHHTSVDPVTMSTPTGRGSESLTDQSGGQSMHQGSGQSNAQETGQGTQSTGATASGQQNASASSGSRSSAAGQGGVVSSSVASSPGGHISVMA